MLNTVTILTHSDLDGMVSGILLLRAVSQDASIRITNGEKLLEEMSFLAGLPKPPQDVYLADIPLVSHARTILLGHVAELKQKSCRMHVYDHHHGWESAQTKDLFATFVIDVRKTTAAAIVWRELLRTDAPSQRWLRLLSEKDRSADPQIVEHFGLLAALTQPMHKIHAETAIRTLASGGKLSPEQKALSCWYFDIHMPKEHEIASQAEIFTTSHGYKLAWIDLRPYQERFSVSLRACEMHGADVVATVISGGVLLGGKSIDQGIDLSFLHGEHTINNEIATIVGHKSPVRISPKVGLMTDSFVMAVRMFIIDRL